LREASALLKGPQHHGIHDGLELALTEHGD
jgi:hypothetical protein